jgi:hypothetical protein
MACRLMMRTCSIPTRLPRTCDLHVGLKVRSTFVDMHVMLGLDLHQRQAEQDVDEDA